MNQMREMGRAGLLAGLLVLALALPAAADATWTGTTDQNFEDDTNWDTAAPANDTTTDVAILSGTPANSPLLTKDRSVAGLKFMPGTWSVFDSGTTYTLSLGTEGVRGVDASYTTVGGSAILSVSDATYIRQDGGGGYNLGWLKINSKITGTGSLIFEGTQKDNYQTPIYVNGDNDFSGGVTFNIAAYVHYGNATAFGSKANMTVTVVGSNSGQSSYASKLYLDSAAGSFSANIDEIIVDGEKKFAAAFYQGRGTTVSTKITLTGGTYGFHAGGGTGHRYNTGEIALKAGTVSTLYKEEASGTYNWYQNGTITGGGGLKIAGYNSYDEIPYFNGDNTYSGGTVVEKQTNEQQTYVGHNHGFGTGVVQLASDTDNKEAFRLNANLTMDNDFLGRGKIGTASYVLTATGSMAPRDTLYSYANNAFDTPVSNIGAMYAEDLDFRGTFVFDYDTDGGDVAPDDSDVIIADTLVFGAAGGAATVDVNWMGAGDPGAGDYVLFTYGGTAPTISTPWTVNAPAGLGGTVWVNDASSQVVLTLAVPEPASMGLLGLGLIPLLRRRRHR